MIRIVLSDGNTGVARGAFIAARKSKKRILTNVAPAKMTDNGPLPEEFKYGLNTFYECKNGPAWLENIRNISTVTLVLYAAVDEVDKFVEVEEACRQSNKPCVKYRVDVGGNYEKQAAEISEALFQTEVADILLNVIGLREAEHPGIQDAADSILTILFATDIKTYSWDPFYFQQMTGHLQNYIVVPEKHRYVIPYEYRKVTEEFFKVFNCWQWFAKPAWMSNVRPHRGGNFRHGIRADDGFTIEIEATVDSNERLVKFETNVVKMTVHTGVYENRVGSDHWRRTYEHRALTEKDIAMLRELLDRCTKPRAPELAQLLCGTRRTLPDGTEVYISDNHVVFKSKTCPTTIPLQLFYEFLEWSYSYLECFTLEKFVEANLPWSRIGLKSRYMMSILRLSDPRRIYSYAYVLDAYLNRVSTIHNLYYQYQGTHHDFEFLKHNTQMIKGNLRKCFGVEYVECE